MTTTAEVAAERERHGYLLVHFVEDQVGHAEKIHLSLSVGDDPLRWTRLNGGRPVLESTAGTGGVRDPHVVRGPDGFHIVATDLRVWRPEGPDWWAYRHRGSRDLVVWDSPDLLTWSEPRLVTVAPPSAGMAWAPEAIYDPVAGEYLVHFSAGLAASGDPDDPDPEQRGTGPSRIMITRTRDFVTFTPAETYLELPGGVIDMTLHVTPVGVHRFAKQDDAAPDTWQVFHQRGDALFAEDVTTLARNIGDDVAPQVEGPLVFQENGAQRWYLWVDQYSRLPQGYHAYVTTDLDSGRWDPVELQLPEATKHGAVIGLFRDEHEALVRHWPG
ncbi:1,4-beta-xylanase [Serinibacter arcticus]|uniref:1,4-beta-xylanase n=1 Tax=Serinibacter arcticus TaxID=1655435 RepID=A0A2U1ZXU8_9MICO|nr:glycoside hydrolase family 43 protein [Serinibacter arcticus]PWD51809.1 1,4-beta-xylanase [Serinibacter arcticus]